jgi:glutathione S-transferase
MAIPHQTLYPLHSHNKYLYRWELLVVIVLQNYTQVEFDKVFSHLNEYLKDKEFLVADRLTGADFMMGFGLHALVYHMGQGENYPHIQRYVAGLSQLPSWQAAVQIEQNGVKSQK